jgi:hypothetical protein
MTARSLAEEIRRVVRNELDDADRAIKNGDPAKARRELDDAVSKLKRIADGVARLD